jgi:hypothetical protein
MVGSCVTTMNIKNVGSCVNNIHFVTCSLVVMIIICPYFYWKMYAINVHKENITEYKKALSFVLYISAYEVKCNRVSLEKKCS